MWAHEENEGIQAGRPRKAPDLAAPERATAKLDRVSAESRAGRALHGPPAVLRSEVLGLQRTIGNAAVAQLLKAAEDDEASPVRDVVGRGGGSPLDAETRAHMEPRFGQDFSTVRVHTDAKAVESARAVGARAYTVGNDIVLGNSSANLGSPTWQRTLAHELTHVVQQRSGPVEGTEAPGGIKISDPSDRFEREAEQTADRVMQRQTDRAPGSKDAPGVGVPLQRRAEEEEDENELGE